MKATILCKNNCITVKCKKEEDTLYDTDIAEMLRKDNSVQDFTDDVYDYFEDSLENAEINYKELQQVCSKVYKSLKG